MKRSLNSHAIVDQLTAIYDQSVANLRQALARSKNVVSVRLLQAISPGYARDYLQRFGFDAAKHPDNLTMVLGSGSVTPLQMAGAYAVFANGGFRVAPRLIEKITDARGTVLWQAVHSATVPA